MKYVDELQRYASHNLITATSRALGAKVSITELISEGSTKKIGSIEDFAQDLESFIRGYVSASDVIVFTEGFDMKSENLRELEKFMKETILNAVRGLHTIVTFEWGDKDSLIEISGFCEKMSEIHLNYGEPLRPRYYIGV